MYTLDTNAIIDYLNGEPAATQTLDDIFDQRAPRYISTITVLELFSRRDLTEGEKRTIDAIIDTLFVVPLDIDLAREAGNLRSLYGIKIPDSAFAATALRTRSTLITRNVRDFRSIRDLPIGTLDF